MEVTVVVLHKGALAHYTVSKEHDSTYSAHLIRYGGEVRNKPPRHLQFVDVGRHCTGNCDSQALMDDLCYTAKEHFGGQKAP
jgi:uncharacterized protein (UPF0262 family)